jgi:hypothetical protein
VFINNKKQFIGNRKVYEFTIATDHILLFDISLLKFEDNEDVVLSDNNWNSVEFSYVDHIGNNGVPAKWSGIHVSQQRSAMEDIKFTNSLPSLLSGNLYPNSLEANKRVQVKKISLFFCDSILISLNQFFSPCFVFVYLCFQITEDRLQNEKTKVLSSPILSSSQLQPPIAEVRKGPGSTPILPVKRSFKDVTGETSKRLREEGVHPITIPSDPPVFQSCSEESSEHESEEYSSKTASEGSDSDPFDRVDRRLGVNEEETISSASSSGDASLGSIREAINSLELLMVKDLSEVSSDPNTQSELHQLLDLLCKISHPKVTVEVKEAIVDFKRKALLSFQEFQSTVESVNKLKDFERHLARIKKETKAGKGRRKDLKNSKTRVSSAIKTEISRKKDLEAEIATLRIQLSTKEKDREQLVLNLKNQEESLSTYSTSYASLNEQAQALLKQADDLFSASNGIKHEGKAAEAKQSTLKSTWSIDLTNQFNKIKNYIIHLP